MIAAIAPTGMYAKARSLVSSGVPAVVPAVVLAVPAVVRLGVDGRRAAAAVGSGKE